MQQFQCISHGENKYDFYDNNIYCVVCIIIKIKLNNNFDPLQSKVSGGQSILLIVSLSSEAQAARGAKSC